MKKLWDLKQGFSNLELQGQRHSIIMGVTRLLLLGQFYTIQTKRDQTFWRGVQAVCKLDHLTYWNNFYTFQIGTRTLVSLWKDVKHWLLPETIYLRIATKYETIFNKRRKLWHSSKRNKMPKFLVFTFIISFLSWKFDFEYTEPSGGCCTLGDFRNISTIFIFLLAVPPYNFCNFDTKMV